MWPILLAHFFWFQMLEQMLWFMDTAILSTVDTLLACSKEKARQEASTRVRQHKRNTLTVAIAYTRLTTQDLPNVHNWINIIIITLQSVHLADYFIIIDQWILVHLDFTCWQYRVRTTTKISTRMLCHTLQRTVKLNDPVEAKSCCLLLSIYQLLFYNVNFMFLMAWSD